MKEYQIQVTSVVTVYVDADNEDEAINQACEKALWEVAETIDTVILRTVDLDD